MLPKKKQRQKPKAKNKKGRLPGCAPKTPLCWNTRKNYDGKARIIRAGGLPSRTAPVTAGEIIADCVEEILETYIDKKNNCDKERGGNREP